MSISGSNKHLGNPKIAASLNVLASQHQRAEDERAERIKWIDENVPNSKPEPKKKICRSCMTIEDGRPHRPGCRTLVAPNISEVTRKEQDSDVD